MKKLRRKLLSLLVVILLAFFATVGVTYAYWNMLVRTETPIVTISEGDEIIVNVTTEGSGKLIPVGQIPTAGEVTSIVFEYEVSINQPASDALATTLTVDVQNVLIGGVSTYASLANIVVTPDPLPTLSTTAVTVTVTITLTEPSDQVAYDAIKNQNITFDLVFTAS